MATHPRANDDRSESAAADSDSTLEPAREHRAQPSAATTAHPTGEQQAGQNAENEPAG